MEIAPKVLAGRTKQDYEKIPKPYRDVAEGMETQFTQNLLQEMQKSINRNEPLSSAEQFYDSMLTAERAKAVTQSGGTGVKELILDQIYPQHKTSGQEVSKAYQNIKMAPKE